MLRDDNAVSAPRPHALHRGPVTQPQCHVLHVVLHGSHEPSGSRSIDTLVLLEHRLLTDARMSDERAVRPHTVSSFVQRSGAARAPDCSQEVGVVRRPSALLQHGHETRCQRWLLVLWPQCAAASATCGSSRAGAILWTAATMDGLPRRQWSFTPHQCSQLRTEGRTQKSERVTRRAVTTASRPEQLRTCRGFVRAPGVLG